MRLLSMSAMRRADPTFLRLSSVRSHLSSCARSSSSIPRRMLPLLRALPMLRALPTLRRLRVSLAGLGSLSSGMSSSLGTLGSSSSRSCVTVLPVPASFSASRGTGGCCPLPPLADVPPLPPPALPLPLTRAPSFSRSLRWARFGGAAPPPRPPPRPPAPPPPAPPALPLPLGFRVLFFRLPPRPPPPTSIRMPAATAAAMDSRVGSARDGEKWLLLAASSAATTRLRSSVSSWCGDLPPGAPFCCCCCCCGAPPLPSLYRPPGEPGSPPPPAPPAPPSAAASSSS